MPSVFLNIPVPATTGSGAPVNISALGFCKLFSLTGGFGSVPNLGATVVIEASNDGVSWSPVTSLTAANDIRRSFAAVLVRATVIGDATGANLSVGADNPGTDMTALAVPAGNGVGAAVDISSFGSEKTVLYNGGMEASLTIEISQDGGLTYTEAASFVGKTPASVNLCCSVGFIRVRVGGFNTGGGTGVISVCAAKPSGGGATSILWAPAGGGDAVTWAEVMGFVNAANAPITIYVSATGPAPVPAGTYNMKYATFYSVPTIGNSVVDLADGAVLHNLGKIFGQMAVQGNQTGGPCLTFDIPSGGGPSTILLEFNGTLQNNGVGPMIVVADNQFFVVGFLLSGGYNQLGGQPLVSLGANSVLIMGAFGNTGVPNDFVTGPATASLLIQNLGGFPSPLPTNAGFLGTTVQNLLFGFSCLNVASRPFNPFGGPILVGTMVFDQSLGITGLPIWWDGTQWVDATGAPA